MTQCPCGSQIDYSACCGLYHRGSNAPTPEALMRSRYSAYTLVNIAYIRKTMKGKPLSNFDDNEARDWAQQVNWIGLQVVNVYDEAADKGFVEFIARFMKGDKLHLIHEISEFHRENGQWLYVDGVHPKPVNPLSQSISRNSSCPCGSLKKFKNCHGHKNR